MDPKIPSSGTKRSPPAGPASSGLRESSPIPENQHRSRKRSLSGVQNDYSLIPSKKSKTTFSLLVLKPSEKNCIGVGNKSQAHASACSLSKLPLELAEMVFDYRELNPIQLMTLLDAKKSDGRPSNVSLLASRNEYWASYALQGNRDEAIPQGYYAHQFVERYQTMLPEYRRILEILWTGTIEEKSEIIERMIEQRSASAWHSYDIMRAVIDFQNFNPRQLMTMLGDKNSDSSLFDINSVALSNEYWVSFAPEVEKYKAVPEGYHAQQFTQRYRAMPPRDRKILEALWTGTDEEKNQTVSRMIEQPSASVWDSYDIVRVAVGINCQAFENVSWDQANDRGIVLAAVGQDGSLLEDVVEDMKRDPEVVFTAVKQDSDALAYASEDLQDNRKIVLTAVEKDGLALVFASENLQDDRQIVFVAVKQDGRALEFASENLQRDEEIVLAAVRQKVEALQFAHESLKNDQQFMLAAVRQDGWALGYASENLKDDREVVLAAVQQDGWALRYASENLKDDLEIVLTAIERKPAALACASENLRNNREIVLAALSEDGWALGYASENLRNDRNIVLAAVKQNGEALHFASEDLKWDPVLRALAGWPSLP